MGAKPRFETFPVICRIEGRLIGIRILDVSRFCIGDNVGTCFDQKDTRTRHGRQPACHDRTGGSAAYHDEVPGVRKVGHTSAKRLTIDFGASEEVFVQSHAKSRAFGNSDTAIGLNSIKFI